MSHQFHSQRRAAWIACLALGAASCGGGPSGTSGGDPADGNVVAERKDESGAGTAAAERIDCASRPPVADTRGDILGIGFGMSAEDAYATLACANPAFKVRYRTDGGFELESLPDGRTPRKLIQADAGLEKMLVYLVGLPGAERVVAVHREVQFGEGNEPPADSVFKRLTDKYGRPTYEEQVQPWAARYEVPYAPDGQIIPRDSASFFRCIDYRTGGHIEVDESCGLSVNFEIDRKQSNLGLASAFVVVVVDQRRTIEAIQAFNEHARGAQEARRKGELDAARRDVDAAGDRARMPDL